MIPATITLSLLALSNGHGVARYDTNSARIDSFRPALYARYDRDAATPELMRELYFGVRTAGANTWLTEPPRDERGYVPGTGIVRVRQTVGALAIEQYFFSSYAAEAPHLIAIVKVTNEGDASLTDAAVFSLHDLRAGDDETLSWVDDAFEERGANGLLLHRSLNGPPLRHDVAPYDTIAEGNRLSDTDSAGPAPDLVVGFEWDLEGLAAGATRTFGVVIGYASDGDRPALDETLGAIEPIPSEALAGATASWDAFQARAPAPPGLSNDERRVYRQALATLRMAQVREEGSPRGQIVAELETLARGRTWVRDQAYAIRALARARLLPEARDALAFVLRARAGTYQLELRGPYGVSVLRYDGNGDEETDVDDAGPVIGLDGFGLTLIALADYVEASGDTQLLTDGATAIFELVADVLMQQIDIDDSLLVRDDNSIWNGDLRKYSYSQAATIEGLRAASRLAARVDDPSRASQYEVAADLYADAFADRLIDRDSQRLNTALQVDRGVLDGAVVETFNWDVLPADGATALATLEQLRTGLARDAGVVYVRNDEGDDRESTFVELRVATAERRAGNARAADALIDHVTARARANHDLVPDDHADGAATVGMAAATYVLALWERADIDAPSADCGCHAGTDPRHGPTVFVVVLAVALAMRRRR